MGNDKLLIGKHIPVVERRTRLEEQYSPWQRKTIATHFQEVCQRFGTTDYVHINDETITYEETWKRAKAYAKAMLKLGVKRRDHIAVLMENDLHYPALFIATSIIGAVIVPLNSMLRQDELAYILTQSDAKYLFFHQTIKRNDYEDMILQLLEDSTFQKEHQLRTIVCLQTTAEPCNERFLSWETFINFAHAISDELLENRKLTSEYPDEIAIIMYTSGSTGLPKGVMLSHDHLLRCAYSTCYSRAIETGRVTYGALPFYHCFAIVEGLLAMSFVGGSFVSANRFSPLSALEQMEKYRANDFLCVPSMLIPLLNEPRVKEFDLSHLFAMWCGAAPAPAPVWQKAKDVLGMTEIITGYGQTEVSSSGVTTEIGDSIERIVTRVGRPKLGGAAGLPEFNGSTVEYKTIDPETGEDLPKGMIGEFVVRGNTVTRGYYNKPDETAATIDKDGWLRTGDVGIIDEKGYLEHLGRSNDLYKVSGELVAPREVEEVIVKHPAVNQVFIVGVPDRITTEAGVAFIELKQGEKLERKDIIDWCKGKVARFKVPRHVWFIEPDEWPMTSTGKVQKFRLQEMAKKRLNITDETEK